MRRRRVGRGAGVLLTVGALAAALAAAPAARARADAVRPGGDAAATFRTVPTARLLDTRSGLGAPAQPLAGRHALALTVLGRGGVPATGVSAVALTLTVTRPVTSGYLSAYPAGTERPEVSNLDFAAGQTRAVAAVVRVGTGGQVDLFDGATGATDVVADVSGYYLDGTPTEAGAFGALYPARLLDTRAPADAVPESGSLTVPVTGRGGVPADGVAAVVVTLTAVAPHDRGYLTAYASGTPAPATSTLNFAEGDTVANLAVVRVGTDGAIVVANSAGVPVDVLVDVSGYVLGGSPTAGGTYVPVPPQRVLDTRDGTGGTSGAVAGGHATTVPVTAGGAVPRTGVSAVVLNVTATSARAAGYVTAYRPTSAIPTASILDYAAGRTAVDLAIVPVGPAGTVALANGGTQPVQLVADLVGYVVAPTPQVEPVPDDTTFDATDVSCAPGLCLAVGNHADASLEYATFDGSTWSAPHPVPGLGDGARVSCTSSTFCLLLASDYRHSVTFDGHAFGAPVALPAGFDVFDRFDVDCGSATLCVAEGGNSEGEPDAARWDGTGWSLTPAPPVSSFELSCEPADCTMVSGRQVARYDGSTWASLADSPSLGGDPVLSCAGSRCLAVGNTSTGLRSAVLSGGTWSAPLALPSGANHGAVGLSCVSATWCMATAQGSTSGARNAVRDTVFDGSTWSAPVVAAAFGAAPTGSGLSCATTTLCARADVDGGYALSTWTGSWVATAAFPDAAVDVACASATSCLAVDDRDRARVWNGSTWTDTPAAPRMGTLRGVSCASATRCVAVGARVDDTAAATAWDGSTWSSAPQVISGLGYAADVSCTGATFCLAVGGAHLDGRSASDNARHADTAEWSRFTGTAWTAAAGVGAALLSTEHVSCTSSTFCASAAVTGKAALAVPVTWTGSAWRPFVTHDHAGVPPVSCAPGTTTCRTIGVYRDPYARMLVHTGTGAAWTEGYGIGSGYDLALSCPGARSCVAAGGAFTDPDSDELFPVLWLYDGAGWSEPVAVPSGALDALGSVSCAGTSFCAVTRTYVDTDGD